MSVILTDEKLRIYKLCPEQYDFDMGAQLGNTDAMCGINTIFDETHSQAFRNGYCYRYAMSKIQCFIDKKLPDSVLCNKYDNEEKKIKQQMESAAKVKYNEAPKVSNTDFDMLRSILGGKKNE